MLEVDHISKRFGRVEALRGVSFSIPAGKIWGLAGANGAGKTTMLRILCGAEEEDSGRILWQGENLLADVHFTRQCAALMPDVLPDATDITVAEYLDFHRRAFRRDAGAVQHAMEFCGIAAEWQKRFLSELSRGMKQRVSLARMLIADPALFLLDEPGAGLDPRGRIELRDLLRRLAAAGHTVIVSSHILMELQEVIEGIVIFEAGKVVLAGQLNELLSQYQAENLEDLYLKTTKSEVEL